MHAQHVKPVPGLECQTRARVRPTQEHRPRDSAAGGHHAGLAWRHLRLFLLRPWALAVLAGDRDSADHTGDDMPGAGKGDRGPPAEVKGHAPSDRNTVSFEMSCEGCQALKGLWGPMGSPPRPSPTWPRKGSTATSEVHLAVSSASENLLAHPSPLPGSLCKCHPRPEARDPRPCPPLALLCLCELSGRGEWPVSPRVQHRVQQCNVRL